MGWVPDQGMMIWISVTDLLDSLHGLLTGRSDNASFTGVGSSFGIRFRATKTAIGVRGRGGPVARVGRAAFAAAVLSAAEEFASRHLSAVPPRDGVTHDYMSALDRFRLTAGRQC